MKKTIARAYRPQTFQEVVGQEALIKTLMSAIKRGRLAHAYLFSGTHGTGKTTVARLFAKALNCTGEGDEPCNQCQSCREIASGGSLDVLEIDGASNRGIEDVRQINETVGYATSTGGYKIYIIDEVHMLTKEAFNALLKTLEEPPERTLFMFATTEPHKIPATILSRCQRYDLKRIPDSLIASKLQRICQSERIVVDEEALRLIGKISRGSLRDAESLLDQVFAFGDSPINEKAVADLLGVASSELFFEIDSATKAGNSERAFEIIDSLFENGKDPVHFLDTLIDHYRDLLKLKITGHAPLTARELEHAKIALSHYSEENLITIVEQLIEASKTFRFSPSPKATLEVLVLKIIRIHQRIPIPLLVKRLEQLEKGVPAPRVPAPVAPVAPAAPAAPVAPVVPAPISTPSLESTPTPAPNVIEDPTPEPEEIPTPKLTSKPTSTPEVKKPIAPSAKLDTIIQFAAVELEGTVRKG